MLYNIIIEGADNVGKSTLIKQIQQIYANKISKSLHFTKPFTNNPYQEQKDIAFNYIKMLEVCSSLHKEIILNDRSIFGEFVYSEFRGYDIDYSEDLLKAYSKLGIKTLFILLYADNNLEINNKIDSKDEYAKISKKEYVSSLFINMCKNYELHKYMKILLINSLNFEYLVSRNDYVLEHIKHFINGTLYKFDIRIDYNDIFYTKNKRILDNGFLIKSKIKCKIFNNNKCNIGNEHKTNIKSVISYNDFDNPIFGCGSIDPKFIFIGEVPYFASNNFNTFLPFYGSKSSNLLHQFLHNTNIQPYSWFITNSVYCTSLNNNTQKNHYCNDILLNELDYIDTNKKAKIVCLGRKTFAIIKNLNIHKDRYVGVVNHPSYYLRFNMQNYFYTDLYKLIKEDI